MTTTYDNVKIHEALELLDEAAADEQSDLRDMLADRYHSLRDLVGTVSSDVQREISGVYSAARNRVRGAVSDVDNRAHTTPWVYIGGAAVLGFVVGLILLRGRK